MTPEELARKYIAAIKDKNLKDLEILVHPKFKYGKFTAASEKSFEENFDYTFAQGRQQALGNVLATHEAFTDFNFEILAMTTNEKEIWIYGIIKGIHTGSLIGILPTNRKLSYRVFMLLKIENGKIIELESVVDYFDLFRQLGKFVFETDDKQQINKYLALLRKLDLVKTA